MVAQVILVHFVGVQIPVWVLFKNPLDLGGKIADTVFVMSNKNKKTQNTIDFNCYSHEQVKKALKKNYFKNGFENTQNKHAFNFLFEIALFNLEKLKNNNI